MSKINKVIDEIERMKMKISEYQGKLKELEQQKMELENSEIVGIVRSGKISADELNELIKNFRKQPSETLKEDAVLPTNNTKGEIENED